MTLHSSYHFVTSAQVLPWFLSNLRWDILCQDRPYHDCSREAVLTWSGPDIPLGGHLLHVILPGACRQHLSSRHRRGLGLSALAPVIHQQQQAQSDTDVNRWLATSNRFTSMQLPPHQGRGWGEEEEIPRKEDTGLQDEEGTDKHSHDTSAFLPSTLPLPPSCFSTFITFNEVWCSWV